MRYLLLLPILFMALTTQAGVPEEAAANQRVLKEDLMLGTLKSVQDKYGVECKAPEKESSISWVCLQQTTCSYKISVTCKNLVANPLLGMNAQRTVVTVYFIGVDNGLEATLTQVNIDHRSGM